MPFRGLAKCCLAALIGLSGTACMAQEPHVRLKGERFTVEVADADGEQVLGLMFRDRMPRNHGMLFIFPGEAMRSFWMKNTRIPLDIIYFDENLRLVNVVHGARPCNTQRCPDYPSTGPAKYVLELNQGLAVELDLQAGDVLELNL